MKLSNNFYLNEFTVSETASRLGIDNTPSEEVIERLRIVSHTQEIIRCICGNRPIVNLSGYRSPDLNKAVGGAKFSAHMTGDAVDFIVVGMDVSRVIELIRDRVGYDKLIDEFGDWVHLGLADNNQNIVYRARKVNGRTSYIKI